MRRYVWEVYPSLMYGQFARPPPKIEIPLDAPPQVAWDIARTLKNHPGLDPKVAARIDRAARSISDAQIDYLLRHRDWRVRMCAGWYIGLTKRETYVPRLGELLSRAAPHEVFSYCVALALIGGDMAECCLRDFIQSSSEKPDDCNREIAMEALAYSEGAPAATFDSLAAYLKQRNMLPS